MGNINFSFSSVSNVLLSATARCIKTFVMLLPKTVGSGICCWPFHLRTMDGCDIIEICINRFRNRFLMICWQLCCHSITCYMFVDRKNCLLNLLVVVLCFKVGDYRFNVANEDYYICIYVYVSENE
jgi:hypothetical protein